MSPFTPNRILAACRLTALLLCGAALSLPAREARADEPPPAAAPAKAASTEARIARVIEGLRPETETAGEPKVRWTLADRMAHYNVPGVSIAVIDGGKIVWAKGFGVRETGKNDPVDEQTLFQAASISKPVAAIGVMKLVKAGTLDLDTDVNTYLKSWKLPDSPFTSKSKVTLRDLLSHSAGLTVHGFLGYPLGSRLPTIPEVLDGEPPAISPPVRSERAPGLGFKYSGGGTTVAQLVVSDVTDKDSAEFLNENVLKPLGMASSTYQQPLPASLAGKAASGHHGSPAKALEGKWHVYPMVFAAGLWTTPTDLCRMELAVQRAFAGDTKGPLDPGTVKEMLTVTAEPLGIGFFLQGKGDRLRFYHGGSNDGFLSFFEAYAKGGKGYAVMINGDTSGALLGEIGRAIKAEYGWPDDGVNHVAPAKKRPGS